MTSGAAASASRVDHPLFARIWPVVAAHEAEAIRALRRENLAGLSGRVLEVVGRRRDELCLLPGGRRTGHRHGARAAACCQGPHRGR